MNNTMAYLHHRHHHSDTKRSTETHKVEIDTTANYQQLGYAIALQAAKDFFEASEKGKAKIIKDLRTPRMQLFSNDLSLILAEKLENNPAEIEANLKWQEKEEETECVTQ